MTTNELKFWKRFIDDGLGIWRGTKRSFETFVRKLNNETMKYGIKFPVGDIQFGKSVHFLDITFYIDEHNRIHYKGYTKPTDAKRYLRPQSFHPKTTFTSVPLSQMIRTIERNSSEENLRTELEKLHADFIKSGYEREELKKIEERAKETVHNRREREEQDVITFPLFYYAKISDIKQILKDSEAELNTIIGNTKIILAMKKNPSIGNMVVKNKMLMSEFKQLENQKCGATNCRQCPLVNTNNTVSINNMIVKPSKTLNCKSKNVIYLWQCQICQEENGYFGRTVQETHNRTNVHRGCFTEGKWEDSALAMHSHNVHRESMALSNFRITLVKKCSPQLIRREEFKMIDKYRTRTMGINRYKN